MTKTTTPPPPPKTNPKTITYICISPTQTIKPPHPLPGEIIYTVKGNILAWGGTAILEHLPSSGTVMKTPIPDPYCRGEEEDHRRNMRAEARVYEKIGENPRVPRVLNWDEKTCCLEMEFLVNGDLKAFIQENQHQGSTSSGGGVITPHLRLQWCKQAASALNTLHSVGVLHCDISPRNFLLDADLNLKIADFGGASICGAEPSATPATRFRHPDYDWSVPPVVGDDIFSLGSLVYFIMTGEYPYGDVASEEVERLYGVQRFPDVGGVDWGDVVMGCWRREVDSAQVVYDLLVAVERERSIDA